MIEFKLIGNWRKYQTALATMPIIIKNASLAGQRKAADQLIRIVKKHIDNQDLGWAERSENTRSGDSRILVDYGEYQNSIKSWRKNDTYLAGVKSDAYNHRGVNISDYAAYHEYGTATEPARPLWGPSLSEIGGSKGVRQIVINSIYQKLKILQTQGFEVYLKL